MVARSYGLARNRNAVVMSRRVAALRDPGRRRRVRGRGTGAAARPWRAGAGARDLADGTQAVSGSFDTSAIRWSLPSNAAEQVLRFHEGAVNAVAFLKDGRIATSGEDARIAIWTPGEPQPSMVLEGHKAPVVALAVSPDGATLASASWDHTARLWPLSSGRRRHAARDRRPPTERQRRGVHARRPRVGHRRL